MTSAASVQDNSLRHVNFSFLLASLPEAKGTELDICKLLPGQSASTYTQLELNSRTGPRVRTRDHEEDKPRRSAVVERKHSGLGTRERERSEMML
eukprot:750533-Hanusia_phi.AAC.1